MKIVLMADNRKTELLVNFCIAYKTLLSKHQLISVYSTAKYLKSSVDIEVSGLNVDYMGGIEQLASRAEFDEIDCVIYLRDATSETENAPSDLLRVCDSNNIPFATNLATAEILILAIDRGDLDYRNWIKDSKVS
ncbi:MAG: methylglyoxal synthase [Clostridiales bacterium]|nr:methylglyoxal synthase [Clostridiales bacterium]